MEKKDRKERRERGRERERSSGLMMEGWRKARKIISFNEERRKSNRQGDITLITMLLVTH